MAFKKYNPDRSPDWNYGGKKWRLSRSKIELFVECPRCFYLDNKLGTGRPKGPAFTINIAVDILLKKEFDIHRAKNSKHPLMERYGIDAVPFVHSELDTWRENFKGLEYEDSNTNLLISGALDDVWIDSQGKLIVVDYKSTSKSGRIDNLDDSAWKEQYSRQIGVYQWLLTRNGFNVSEMGYFVYANASTDKEAFDGRLEFELTLVPLTGDTSWIEPTLADIKSCLEVETIPAIGEKCEFCVYRESAGKKLQARYGKAKKTVIEKPSDSVSLGI